MYQFCTGITRGKKRSHIEAARGLNDQRWKTEPCVFVCGSRWWSAVKCGTKGQAENVQRAGHSVVEGTPRSSQMFPTQDQQNNLELIISNCVTSAFRRLPVVSEGARRCREFTQQESVGNSTSLLKALCWAIHRWKVEIRFLQWRLCDHYVTTAAVRIKVRVSFFLFLIYFLIYLFFVLLIFCIFCIFFYLFLSLVQKDQSF